MHSNIKLTQSLDAFFHTVEGHQSISGTSLIMSFFGDYLWVCGGGIWLGSLIQAMETLGFNQRVVRSSVFRLHKDGWLIIRKEGRKSYYFLDPERYNEMLEANKKIYHDQAIQWNQRWNLVYAPIGPTHLNKDKIAFMQRRGFGVLGKDCFIQPDLQQLTAEVKESIFSRIPEAKIFQQSELQTSEQQNIKSTIQEIWDVEKIGQDYQHFCQLFEPIDVLLKKVNPYEIEPEQAFKLRLLVIHFYRRIIVKDPSLPVALLPTTWPRNQAQKIVSSIYKKVHEQSLKYILNNGETTSGKLPVPSPNYYIRFGGLT